MNDATARRQTDMYLALLSTLGERFCSKVLFSPGCWTWQAGRDAKGYGKFWNGQMKARAHRVAYEAFAGAIPDGLQIDHLCRNRACIRPDHLEPVTARVNVLRGVSPKAVAHVTGICVSGRHHLAGDNVLPNGHWRRCRACHNEWRRNYRAKQAVQSWSQTEMEAAA